MLDIKFIRSNPEIVKKAMINKNMAASAKDIDSIINLEEDRRNLSKKVDDLRFDRKNISSSIAKLMAEGKNTEAENAKLRVAAIKEEMHALEEELRSVTENQQKLLLVIPNVPHADAPVGKGEEDNVTIKEVGTPVKHPFPAKPHWEIGEKLGILDTPAGSLISGTGFPVFKGAGARLVRGLMNFMLDVQTTVSGFKEVWIPPLVNRDSMTGTGQLPKFEFDMYRIESDDLFLVPTAEVPVTNLMRDANISYRDLPIRLTAYSPCFRREAGSHGKDTRGLMRLHWFDKVELVSFTKPEDSDKEHLHILSAAEEIIKRLGLAYRVQLLCTGEMSFSGARQYDIEIWAPGVEKWLEVSSVSTFTDFQARRANIRFRAEDGKMQYVHTLNGSGVAFPRLIISLLETYQQPDGSVTIPKNLQPYLGNLEILKA